MGIGSISRPFDTSKDAVEARLQPRGIAEVHKVESEMVGYTEGTWSPSHIYCTSIADEQHTRCIASIIHIQKHSSIFAWISQRL